MSFVLDASVTLAWFLEDERTRFTDSLLESLSSVDYWVPSVWHLEVVNALLVAERKRRISPETRFEALNHIAQLNVRVDASVPNVRVIGALSHRHSLTAYDAAYLELAVREGLGLVSLDGPLVRAASAEGVPVEAPGRSTAGQRRRRYNI